MKPKELKFPNNLPIAEEETEIDTLVLSKMPTTSSKIWNRLAESIFYDNNMWRYQIW